MGTLDNIKTIENFLNIQINIVYSQFFNKIIHNGVNKEVMIYLYKVKNHFHVIKSMEGFYGSSYYCHAHKHKFNNKDDCKYCKNDNNFCNLCANSHDNHTIDWKYCNKCFRNFKNQECFDNHLTSNSNKKSICETIWKCRKCNKNIFWNNKTI
jgi:hypothetical protein